MKHLSQRRLTQSGRNFNLNDMYSQHAYVLIARPAPKARTALVQMPAPARNCLRGIKQSTVWAAGGRYI